jgi:chaperonin GroEL (HSP60 family)
MRYGLDLLNGEIRDNVTAGILEPTMSKVKSLKSAYEAAVSLLRIDDAISVAPGTSCSTYLVDAMGYNHANQHPFACRTKAGA